MKFVFLSGIDRESSQTVYKWLSTHPEIGVLRTAENGLAAEGQYHQTAFPPDDYFGGLGAFAYHSASHLTETVSTLEQKDLLRASWGPLTNGKRHVLEHSPSNLLRHRFLDDTFPGAHHVFVLRHPLMYAYSLRENKHDSNTPLVDLVRHWIEAHEIWRGDLSMLNRYNIVFTEDLMRAPYSELSSILSDLSLPEHDAGNGHKDHAGDSARWWKNWLSEDANVREEVLALEPRLLPLGY